MNTTKTDMKKIKRGDKFTVNNIEHIASTDSHLSGDSTCEEYIVYDEDNEGWFESDFE